MYIDERDQLLRNQTERTVSVWEQRRYENPLASGQANQDRKQQPYVVMRSIWETLYNS